MKLIDLLLRASRRGHGRPDKVNSSGIASDRSDRSSMAELVRLLQETDEAPTRDGHSGASA
jgi:hypothetical protein